MPRHRLVSFAALRRRQRCVWLFPLSALLLGLPGCGVAQRGERITVSGSSTVAPLMNEIAKQYERANPGRRVDVQMGGSSRGLADVRSRSTMVGMISRALKSSEQDLRATTIALDGIALIVNQANPVKQLSDAQIVSIYTGKIRNWRELGGPSAAITVVTKAEGRSTLELFLEFFKLEPQQIRPSVVIGDNQQGILTVAKDPHAIAYVSIGTASYEASKGSPIRLLPLDGQPPTLAAVRSGRYPLSRPLNLVTLIPPPEGAQSLLTYARSAAVDALIEKQFFVVPQR